MGALTIGKFLMPVTLTDHEITRLLTLRLMACQKFVLNYLFDRKRRRGEREREKERNLWCIGRSFKNI